MEDLRLQPERGLLFTYIYVGTFDSRVTAPVLNRAVLAWENEWTETTVGVHHFASNT